MKELRKDELMLVNGGSKSLIKWVKGSFWFGAVTFIYDHWNEIKSGAMDGWEDGGKDL